jgi:hypothetical protein
VAKKTKHSKAEIAAKLAEADDLATKGKPQSEIAHTLGVSVMTLLRWRKLPSAAASDAGRVERFNPNRSGGADSNRRTSARKFAFAAARGPIFSWRRSSSKKACMLVSTPPNEPLTEPFVPISPRLAPRKQT